ncbi:MAG: glycosyltransferase, partial [Actinomycetota bacterium]|nr:glycosyltransferase [Actinomycetota bacterium]
MSGAPEALRRRTPPLRVLLVFPFGVLGGAEIWLLRVVEATDRLDLSAVVLAEGPLREELARRGIDATVMPTGRTALGMGAAIRRLRPEIRQRRPEVVLALGVKGAAVAVPAARLAGVPAVWARPDHSLDRSLARPLGRLADRVVAISPEVGRATGRSDAVVITPPRPERPVARAAARRFWAGRGVELDDGPTLAMATRLIPYKGVDDAIAALAREGAEAWRLVVAGGDDYATPGETDRLRTVAASSGVADRVVFAGPVDGAGRYLAAFDALAVLTKSDARRPGAEGFGIAALEAMTAGVPVVATGSGSLERMVAGGAGVIVPEGDPAAVARALAELTPAAARRRAARAARASATRHP